MKRQSEHVAVHLVTRRHRWGVCSPIATRAGRIERCEECGIVRGINGWWDRDGEWRTTSIPRCGEAPLPRDDG